VLADMPASARTLFLELPTGGNFMTMSFVWL
jgi:hypothetical protein